MVAALSLLLLVATGWGYYNFAALNHNAHTIGVQGLGEPAGGTNVGGTGQGNGTGANSIHVDGTAQNILIVGIDSRQGLTPQEEHHLKVGNNQGTLSTDTIMLVHVPADGSKATLISIPRDSWVSIPGFADAKINAAYADGYYNSGAQGTKAQEAAGASLLVKVVKQLTGVPIDHYVAVGFQGFEEIVKAIGSIPVNLCHAVDDTIAYNEAHGLGHVGSGFKMSAGHHDLNPQQALEFVRQRHNIPGKITDDFGRELRQRYFLNAAFDKILSARVLLNPIKLHNLIKAIDDSFTFDQNGFDITKFAEQMTNLTGGNIVGRSIPIQGNIVENGQDALQVDPAKVRAVVQKAFYGTPSGPAKHHSAQHKHKHKAALSNPTSQGCVN